MACLNQAGGVSGTPVLGMSLLPSWKKPCEKLVQQAAGGVAPRSTDGVGGGGKDGGGGGGGRCPSQALDLPVTSRWQPPDGRQRDHLGQPPCLVAGWQHPQGWPSKMS